MSVQFETTAPGTQRVLRLPVEPANARNTAPYGVLLATDPAIEPLPIRFYGGAVTVRKPGAFQTESPVEFSICRMQPREFSLEYLERHPRHTQAFIPLGGKPFVAVFATPTEGGLPPLDSLRAFRFDGSAGFMMHLNTWHEFPFAVEPDTDVIVVLSRDTSTGLRSDNLVDGEAVGVDIEKRHLPARVGVRVELDFG